MRRTFLLTRLIAPPPLQKGEVYIISISSENAGNPFHYIYIFTFTWNNELMTSNKDFHIDHHFGQYILQPSHVPRWIIFIIPSGIFSSSSLTHSSTTILSFILLLIVRIHNKIASNKIPKLLEMKPKKRLESVPKLFFCEKKFPFLMQKIKISYQIHSRRAHLYFP